MNIIVEIFITLNEHQQMFIDLIPFIKIIVH
jgi:hypothetical protein